MKKAFTGIADGSLLGTPEKDIADIAERKEITGYVNDYDGYLEEVEGENVYHATSSLSETI